jgi:HEAT repeat protein
MAYRPPRGGAAALAGSQGAADAVRHIGTNALPFLVSWIEDNQNLPPWKQRLLRYAWKANSPAREILVETIAKRESRAARASWGFEILGEAAAPAIPELVRVANQGNPASSLAATAALASLGKDALLPLLALMTNSPSVLGKVVAMSAVRSLGQTQHLGTNAHLAVVLLIQYLSDPLLAPSAAEVLGSLGLESDITVPALAECTHSSNPELQIAAATSLGRFGASARPAVPELLKMLDDPIASVRDEATNALQQIAPEALPKTEPP